MGQTLLTAAFVIGAIFGNLLVVQYGWRSQWRATITGHVLLALFAVIAVSYDLSVLFLLWPDVFEEGSLGEVFRVAARFAIDVVLVAMYVLLVRAQRRDRSLPPAPQLDPAPTPPGGARQTATE